MERQDKDLAFLLQYENIAWYEDGKVRILDRRIYPIRIESVVCTTHEEVAQAIADMVTQSGGPYFAAPMGMALAAYECRALGETAQIEHLTKAAYTLSHARPTTMARMIAITDHCVEVAKEAMAKGENVPDAIAQDAIDDIDKKYARFTLVGEYLAEQFPKNGTVMTMCFAETIVGTMLRACRKNGNAIKLICPETRPYYQGARLTASCIYDMGFDVTVITDNMPAYTMKEKKVDVFTSAADVISMDGYVVNKVGTFQIALAAHHWGIPYFVTGTPNRAHPTIDTVEIELRDPNLVIESLGVKTVMDGVKGYYPAFDITPPKFCNGVVTDQGIFSPYDLARYLPSHGGTNHE